MKIQWKYIGLIGVMAVGLNVVGAASLPVSAVAADPVYTGFLSNVAVQGYDPVAYFTDARPVKGTADYAVEYKGAEFRFASAEHKSAFEADPEKYAPQYGGYCAWAMAQGYTAKGDAQFWRIVDDKLYLNYDAKVQQTWETDIAGFIQKADAAWPSVVK